MGFRIQIVRDDTPPSSATDKAGEAAGSDDAIEQEAAEQERSGWSGREVLAGVLAAGVLIGGALAGASHRSTGPPSPPSSVSGTSVSTGQQASNREVKPR